MSDDKEKWLMDRGRRSQKDSERKPEGERNRLNDGETDWSGRETHNVTDKCSKKVVVICDTRVSFVYLQSWIYLKTVFRFQKKMYLTEIVLNDLKKWWKMLFISSYKLFSVSRTVCLNFSAVTLFQYISIAINLAYSKNKLYQTLHYLFRNMFNFDFL